MLPSPAKMTVPPDSQKVDRGAPTLSVVIPKYRRWGPLQLTLVALEGQSMPKKGVEVIVSDDGSEYGAIDNLKANAGNTPLGLEVTTGPNARPSAVRDRGLRLANGNWVAFTDDDRVPAPACLERRLASLNADPELEGVGGKVLRYKDGRIARYVDWSGVLVPYMDKGEVQYLVTSHAVFRNETVQRLAGFNETYKWPGGEDPDLSFRFIAAGGRLKYIPEDLVLHMHRERVKGTYEMFWHHGLGAGVHGKLEGKVIRPALKEYLRELASKNVEKAFKEQTFIDALVFSFLEYVRKYVFMNGFDHHSQASKFGATSAN